MPELWDVYDGHGRKIDGRVSVRGRHDLRPGEYHLVVYIWIINDQNEVIISKRQKGKSFEGIWECTGGCAKQGDSSLSAALREVEEELGIVLDPRKGELFTRYLRDYPEGAQAICDVWVFRQNFGVDQLSLQPSEVSEACIVSRSELEKLSRHTGFARYFYLHKLLNRYCNKTRS